MDTITEQLFERPFHVYFLLGFAEIALAALWQARRTRARLVALAVPPVLALAVFVTARLVVTEREWMIAAVEEMACQTGRGRVEAIEAHLAADARGSLARYGPGGALSRAQLVAAARAAMQHYGVQEVTIKKAEVEFLTPTTARMEVTTNISYDCAGVRGTAMLAWTLDWLKRRKRWAILEIHAPHSVEILR